MDHTDSLFRPINYGIVPVVLVLTTESKFYQIYNNHLEVPLFAMLAVLDLAKQIYQFYKPDPMQSPGYHTSVQWISHRKHPTAHGAYINQVSRSNKNISYGFHETSHFHVVKLLGWYRFLVEVNLQGAGTELTCPFLGKLGAAPAPKQRAFPSPTRRPGRLRRGKTPPPLPLSPPSLAPAGCF